jgi:DNA-binding LacI/PurR family transcriptional regulator
MAARMTRVTAKDVAREAGVSQATVSYVLNDTPNQTIPLATRRRVLDAVERLGYAPSAAARTLRTGTSSTVLLVLPDVPIVGPLSGIADALADALEPHGYSVAVRRHRGLAMLERAWKEIRPAAVVNVASFDADEATAIRSAGIPVVSALPDGEGPGVVFVPHRAAGRLQAAHLLERGHVRIGYATTTSRRESVFAEGRLRGVTEVLVAAGHPAPVVLPVPLDAEAAAASIAPWVTAGPSAVTAVCTYHDDQAFALLAGMRLRGLRAPDDLAVVGMDNVSLAPFADPPLTSVDIGVPRIVPAIAAALLAAIRGESAPAADTAATLVRREST